MAAADVSSQRGRSIETDSCDRRFASIDNHQAAAVLNVDQSTFLDNFLRSSGTFFGFDLLIRGYCDCSRNLV